jgi:hypothetical protein
MKSITPEQLLAEVEQLVRIMPSREVIHHDSPENLCWLGQASAAIQLWDPIRAFKFDRHVTNLSASTMRDSETAIRGVMTMLHQARHELRLNTVGPATIAMGHGSVFDYFDEVRKVIEAAKLDLLFVDPYLDAEFVSRYLPHVSQGVKVRLLARRRLATLTPAVALLRQQNKLAVEVRSAEGFHDRYVFVDQTFCYQSGASFKDGAKTAPTTLTQIVDAFGPVSAIYEQAWISATVQQ